MIPRVTLQSRTGVNWRLPLMLGSYRDLLELTQPDKILATDWQDDNGLDTPMRDIPLRPAKTRPLRLSLGTESADMLDDLATVTRISVEGMPSESVIIDEVTMEPWGRKAVYTLRGEIQQTAPLEEQDELPSIRGIGERYTLPSGMSLADIGATPLDGWEQALARERKYKETHYRDSREVTVSILLQVPDTRSLMASRGFLQEYLFRRQSNHITTPHGVFHFAFTRSKLKSYSFAPPHIIYDLTLTILL